MHGGHREALAAGQGLDHAFPDLVAGQVAVVVPVLAAGRGDDIGAERDRMAFRAGPAGWKARVIRAAHLPGRDGRARDHAPVLRDLAGRRDGLCRDDEHCRREDENESRKQLALHVEVLRGSFRRSIAAAAYLLHQGPTASQLTSTLHSRECSQVPSTMSKPSLETFSARAVIRVASCPDASSPTMPR